MTDSLVDQLLTRSFKASGRLLLDEDDLGDEFFDLSTGVAGELLQKLINYDQTLAVVVRRVEKRSQSFQDLVLEHQHHPTIRFFSSEEAAIAWLAQ